MEYLHHCYYVHVLDNEGGKWSGLDRLATRDCEVSKEVGFYVRPK